MMKIKLKSDHWVPISYKEINSSPEKDKVGNTLLLAPSDVPKAIKLTKFEQGKYTSLSVEFRYSSDSEPIKFMELSDRLIVSYGANSKRVYQVQLQIPTSEYEAKLESLQKNTNNKSPSFIDKAMEELKSFGIRNFETISKIKDSLSFA